MRVLVTGKDGQLGKSIQKLVYDTKQVDDFVFVGRQELDLSSESSIASYFENNDKFDIIINCAAYTAVDKAEEEKNIANQVNHLAVKQLAQIAKNQQAKLIHISTDYVFDGESEKPYTEADATNPINAYGKTKLKGEQAIQELMQTNAIIIRTSWVYSEFGNNFVDTMLKLGKERDELNIVNDQIGSPTYAINLAKAMLDIVRNNEFNIENFDTQIYHYSAKNDCSWYEFTKKIFKIAKITCNVYPIKTDQYPTPAKRPKNTVMSKDKIISTFGIVISDWTESIKACIKNIEDKQ